RGSKHAQRTRGLQPIGLVATKRARSADWRMLSRGERLPMPARTAQMDRNSKIGMNCLRFQRDRGRGDGFGEVAEWLKAPHSKCRCFAPYVFDLIAFSSYN